MQVAFFDPRTDRLVEIETFPGDVDQVRATSFGMTSMWASGRHHLPSPYWVAWEPGTDYLSIFCLDLDRVTKPRTFDRIKQLVDAL